MSHSVKTSALDLLSRATTAASNEYGSVLCAWFDGETKRGCGINSPVVRRCRCQEVARAVLGVAVKAARDVAKGHRDTGDSEAAEAMEIFAEEMERACALA